MRGEQAKPFQLVAGHVVLDFVNTLDNRFAEDGPEELLPSYGELARFLVQAGCLSVEQCQKLKRLAGRAEEEAAGVLARAVGLREALARVMYGLVEGKGAAARDLAALEKYFHEANGARVLIEAGDRLRWRWRNMTDLETPVRLMASAAEELLLTDQAALLRSCASDTCRWLFLDTSKNHTRRWCDMKLCGNRSKARRFRARMPGE